MFLKNFAWVSESKYLYNTFKKTDLSQYMFYVPSKNSEYCVSCQSVDSISKGNCISLENIFKKNYVIELPNTLPPMPNERRLKHISVQDFIIFKSVQIRYSTLTVAKFSCENY